MLGRPTARARRVGRLLAFAVPLLATAWVYAPILHCFFFADDFFNFLTVADAGAYRFIISPMAGHVLYTRNAILAASWLLFGLDARPYFWGVLLTHLVNVGLLFGLMRRLAVRPLVATTIATLWGISPLHAERTSLQPPAATWHERPRCFAITMPGRPPWRY